MSKTNRPSVSETNSARAMAPSLHLRVNGEDHEAPNGATVSDLLSAIGVAGGKVAVERNAAIVPRSLFDATQLADGDAIEIVRFVGGG